jgi:hypothetical protein
VRGESFLRGCGLRRPGLGRARTPRRRWGIRAWGCRCARTEPFHAGVETGSVEPPWPLGQCVDGGQMGPSQQESETRRGEERGRKKVLRAAASWRRGRRDSDGWRRRVLVARERAASARAAGRPVHTETCATRCRRARAGQASQAAARWAAGGKWAAR